MTDAARPPQAGMTADQAADAGRAMYASAKAQKDQIAQSFLAQRQAILAEVARRQATTSPKSPDPGANLPPRESTAPPPRSTPAEIEAVLKAMGVPSGALAPQAAQALILQAIVENIRRLIAEEIRRQLAAAGIEEVPPNATQFFRHNRAL